jgi:hypothetical protein
VTFDEYWSKLKAAGWFEAYSDRTRASMRDNLKRWFDKGEPEYTVFSLGRPVYEIDHSPDEAFVQRALDSYRDASDGLFEPQDIRSEHVSETQIVSVSFRLGNQRFEADLFFEMVTFEEGFDALCNRGLAATGSPYRFFSVPGDHSVAFVTPEAYERVSQLGYNKVRKLSGGRFAALLEPDAEGGA